MTMRHTEPFSLGRIAQTLILMLAMAFLTIIVVNDVAMGWPTNIAAIGVAFALGKWTSNPEKKP